MGRSSSRRNTEQSQGLFGYDGLELGCVGNHFEVAQADEAYCKAKRGMLEKYELTCFSLTSHLVGQAVCDCIDARHETILPPYVWGDGAPEGVRQCAAQEMIATGEAAARFGVSIVNGFTGSPVWHLVYGFSPALPHQIDADFGEFARC